MATLTTMIACFWRWIDLNEFVVAFALDSIWLIIVIIFYLGVMLMKWCGSKLLLLNIYLYMNVYFFGEANHSYTCYNLLCFLVETFRPYTSRHRRLPVLNVLIQIVLGWNNGEYLLDFELVILNSHYHSLDFDVTKGVYMHCFSWIFCIMHIIRFNESAKRLKIWNLTSLTVCYSWITYIILLALFYAILDSF